MKSQIALVFLVAAICAAAPLQWTQPGRFSAAGATYLINQNFEGTGMPSGWSWVYGPDGDPDYTTNPPQGSQSLRIAGTTSVAAATFSAQSTVYVYCLLRVNSTVQDHDVFGVVGATSGVKLWIGAPEIRLSANGGNGAASATSISTGLWHVWIKAVSGGTCEVAMSQDGTKPTTDGSGKVFLNDRTAASENLTEVQCTAFSSDDYQFDRVLISTSPIGENP